MAFLLPVLVATLAAASPLSSFVTKQALPSVPQGWQLEAAAPPAHTIDLHIRLKEENIDQLKARALEISDPDHHDYGKHLSKTEVDALTAPTKETVDSVSNWLASHGIDAGEVNSGFLHVTVSVSQAKKLLDADYGVYTQSATGRQTVRTTSYSLPREVHAAVSMIQPTTLFSDLGISTKKLVRLSEALAGRGAVARDTSICNTERVSTKCLRENYNVKGYAPAGNTTLGINGFLEEVPDLNDLSLYLKKYDSDLPSKIPVKIVSINGGSTTAGGEGEANLDTQIAVPLTYPIPNVFYSTGGRPPINGNGTNDNEPYLDWLKYTMAMDHPSETYSISYGEDETSVPDDYTDAVCTQFLKLGARGVSILVAAGDSGAGSDSACQGSKVQYQPAFPASCPWVTTVGGTSGYGASEQPFRDGGSGFSNHFATPDWQADAVKAYIKTLNGQLSGSFNASGRAYPDISALYTPYPLFQNGQFGYSGGTSASTPTVASIIALLNDYLVSKGKQPLGFLNPFLYKKGQAGLRDITTGHNNVCSTKAAFPATKGWDAASGLGVPDFGKLKALV